jgi:hypothetical protein
VPPWPKSCLSKPKSKVELSLRSRDGRIRPSLAKACEELARQDPTHRGVSNKENPRRAQGTFGTRGEGDVGPAYPVEGAAVVPIAVMVADVADVIAIAAVTPTTTTPRV